MVKLRRITLYRILPIILLSVLLLSICICSNVFSPKSARAIVGEEFIVPAFYAWLNTMNVYLSTYDSSPSDTQYLSNGIWNSLVNVANTQNWLSSAAWTLATLAVELESRISTAFDNNGNGFFQLDQETSTLFDSATRQFIIDNSLSSDVSTPVVIESESGFYFADGSPIYFYPDSTIANSTHFVIGQEYYISNNTIFKIITSKTGTSTYVTEYSQDGVLLRSITTTNNSLGSNSIVSEVFEVDVGNDIIKSTYHMLSNNTRLNQVFGTPKPKLSDWFGIAQTVGYEATTGTIVQNPDIPDDNEDEYGYVGVPNSIDWDSETSGNELIQSMLDYERDKPYSTESEYTYTISNEVPIQPEPEEPGMVELPLIGIQLPSNFNLNLRGIWYYVVQWVNSIRSWFTWMFGVFANLPYAMVVPIYATAVVVIVLGVYKRFFM